MDRKWAEQFKPHSYTREPEYAGESGCGAAKGRLKSNDSGYFDRELKRVNYSPQGMKDLDELGDLVGGGDSEMISLLRPYYSMVEMSANGNKQVRLINFGIRASCYVALFSSQQPRIAYRHMCVLPYSL